MLLMVLFAPWAANGQTIVQIGDGTAQNPTLPVHMVYAYSLTQQIFTADEIGIAGSITSIAFYHNPNTSLTMEDIQVYMMQVDKSIFASQTDIVPLTNATKVFEGTLSANGTGWVTLQLSTPFPYNGESNLLVCCFDPNSNKPGSSERFSTTSTTEYTSLVYYNNTAIPDLNNVSAYTGTKGWYKYRNNIQLEITPNSCQTPTGLNVTLTPGNGTTALLSWTSDANAWQIMLNDDENSLIDVTHNPYTLTGLIPETTYTAKVRTVCSGEDNMSFWSNTVSFTPSDTQVVTIGSGETTNTYLPAYTFYNYNLSEQIYTAEEVGMAGTINSISFFNGGTEKSPEIKIYMVNTDQTEFSSNTNWLAVTANDLVYDGTVTFTVDEWTTIELDTPFEYDGISNLGLIVDEHMQWSSGLACRVFTSTSNCAMYVYSDDTDYDAVGATYTASNRLSVKNQLKLEITPAGSNTCPRPTRLTCTGTTANSATLSWMENGEATEWQICLNGNESNPITVTENPHTLTNLIPETTYTAKVRANCGDEDGMSLWSNTVSFTPSQKVIIGSGTATSDYVPTNTFYNYSYTQQIYTIEELGAPGFIRSIDFFKPNTTVANRNLSIYMVNTDKDSFTGTSDWISVISENLVFSGTVNFANNDWTTITLDNDGFLYDGTQNVAIIVDDNTGSYESSTAFNTFTTPTNQAIYVYSDGTNYDPLGTPATASATTNSKNQIRLEITPAGPITCPRPTRLTCTGTTANTATLSWMENGEATEWQICLNGNESNPITVTENPHTLTNLTPEMAYTAKVRANCGGEDGMSGWSNTISFTPSAKIIITGNQTGTNNYLPFNNFYNYSLTQQIYTIEELGAPGFIRSIDFFKPNTTEANRNLSIYMVDTDKDSFTGASDWISVTTENLVFSGTVDFANNDWTTITLDGYGFLYDGTQNVAIIVDDNTGSYESTTAFNTFTTSANQSIYYYNDNTNYDPSGTPGAASATTNSKNQIRILKDNLSCMPPFNPNATGVTSNSAVLNWTGEAESYNVSYYKAYFFDSFEDDLSQWTIIKDGDDESFEWGIENPHDNSADLNAHGGNYAAVAYSDIDVHADSWLITPQILIPSQATLKFWVMRSTYDDAQDEYEVRLSTTGNAIENFTTILKGKEAANSAWTEVSIDLRAYDGQQCYIAIRHDYTGGFFLMVDDFGIFGWSEEISTTGNSILIEDLLPETEYLWHVQANCSEEDGQSPWVSNSFTTLSSCPVPFDLSVSEETANGATIAWTGFSDSYIVMVSEGGEASSYSYDFENGWQGWTTFQGSTTSPHSWMHNTEYSAYDSNQEQIVPICHNSSSGMMLSESYISASTSGGSDATAVTPDNYLVSPQIRLGGSITFYVASRMENYPAEKFSVMVSESGNTNANDFTHTELTVTLSDNSWHEYTVDLSAYSGMGYVAIRHYDCYDQHLLYIDDVTIENGPIASTWMTYEVETSPFLLNDDTYFLPQTTYLVKVKGICEDEETEYSESITFTTLDESTKIFVTEGDWSDSDNWVPAGVPSIEQDVILRAEATVFDVAEANIITIDDAGALIIEDGGQLKTNANVEATMKKFIIGYGTDYVETNDGYYLMTLPIADPISAADAGLLTEESEYDLYSWDRTATDEEWQNNHNGIDMQNGAGYLYANQDDREMSFTATLRNSSESIVMTPAYDEVEHGGWNLYGNPFPCEAYITTDAEDMTFYRLVGNQLELIEGAIAPLEAFFVKATAAGQTFTISREAPAK